VARLDELLNTLLGIAAMGKHQRNHTHTTGSNGGVAG
jgi:hypothetical protein